MLKHKHFLYFVLIVCLQASVLLCVANNTCIYGMGNQVPIKEAQVQGIPKSSSFDVTLDGHWLTVVFLENLGRVTVEVLDSGGNDTLTESTPTPNGLNIYIPYAGSYVIYFTLSNGDVYYGEFEVTD